MEKERDGRLQYSTVPMCGVFLGFVEEMPFLPFFFFPLTIAMELYASCFVVPGYGRLPMSLANLRKPDVCRHAWSPVGQEAVHRTELRFHRCD